MTSGSRLARAVYSAAVYPAGPLPTMMTFSTRSFITSTVARDSSGLPPIDRPAQLEVGDLARDGGQPERECAVGQNRHHGQLPVDPDRTNPPAHPPSPAPHPPAPRTQHPTP